MVMKEINAQAFKEALENEKRNDVVDFINVCTSTEYKEKYIEGVRSVPLDTLHNHLPEFKDKKTIYIHCRSGARAEHAIDILENLGVGAELINLEGGILAWEKAGFPTKVFTHQLPIMRQMLLTAGFFIVLGVILALTVNPKFVFLALLVGCGQMFAGITGWCGLSHLLEKMPWNK